jgi:hypothetical protein
MSDKPITDLRRRMLQDMTNRNFGAKTQHDYIRHIGSFAKFLGRAPDTATGDDIRRCRIGRPLEPRGEPLATGNVAALRVRVELARRHMSTPEQKCIRRPEQEYGTGYLGRGINGHWGHGSQVCSVAPSGQAPKARSGAPEARGLTARAHTELLFLLPRCALFGGVVTAQLSGASDGGICGGGRLARRLLCASR